MRRNVRERPNDDGRSRINYLHEAAMQQQRINELKTRQIDEEIHFKNNKKIGEKEMLNAYLANVMQVSFN